MPSKPSIFIQKTPSLNVISSNSLTMWVNLSKRVLNYPEHHVFQKKCYYFHVVNFRTTKIWSNLAALPHHQMRLHKQVCETQTHYYKEDINDCNTRLHNLFDPLQPRACNARCMFRRQQPHAAEQSSTLLDSCICM